MISEIFLYLTYHLIIHSMRPSKNPALQGMGQPSIEEQIFPIADQYWGGIGHLSVAVTQLTTEEPRVEEAQHIHGDLEFLRRPGLVIAAQGYRLGAPLCPPQLNVHHHVSLLDEIFEGNCPPRIEDRV
jgi:hypothetical protein